MLRTVLLKASESVWLREHAMRTAFVRRAVSRFMPGETFDDMLAAARVLQSQGLDTVFTRLGENVSDISEADAVATHYLDAIDRIRHLSIAAEPSIKLTQLGLDIDRARALLHAQAIAARTDAAGNYLWVDMEQSPYVDVTLDFTLQLRKAFPRVGVCLQAYLYRTADDLTRMLNAGVGVRLVKGAYREHASAAFPVKRDVDANYFELARQMLKTTAVSPSTTRAVFGTHDAQLIAKICAHAREVGVAPGGYEFHMLYGIQHDEQQRLTRAGEKVRVLIAYGTYWFPWYMRRLAERPANLWFVMKSVFD